MTELSQFFCPSCRTPSAYSFDRKRFSCQHCQFEYFHNVAAAAAAIVEVDAEILAVRRKYNPQQGWLDLPGGFVDYGESVEAALKREIAEELNIQIEHIRYCCSAPHIYSYEAVDYRVVDLFFTCAPVSLVDMSAGDDALEWVFINPRTVDLERFAFHSTRSALQIYRQRLLGP